VNRVTGIIVGVALLAAAVLFTAFGPARRPELWLTPDQRADRLFREGKYGEAAKAYTDPARQGTALYRAGDFKAAATAFARDGTPEGAYDRGNALLMLGKYDDAVKSYDRALSLRPGWKDAQENRAVAVIRRERMTFKGGDATGGQVKADEVVFEKGKNEAGEEVQVAGGDPLSDDQLRALWLRRVQTKPADFLRAKFAFQLEEKKVGTP
jgi:Ca-activated chloride channel family protein